MARAFFADNTVLVNFAHVGRLSLLESVLRGQGTWTESVARECERSSRIPELSDLERVPQILGAPYRPESAQEWSDLTAFRVRLAGPGDAPGSHLGEAETLSVITNRMIGSIFITDDRAAEVLALDLAVSVVPTSALIRLAVRRNLLTAAEAWADLSLLRSLNRFLPGAPTTFVSFAGWVDDR